ncbi:MAG: hypothetical protein PHV16_04305 [Candidatus Nanoarchaeia archaeon]|nr:hypothetical protein [Candidatus Nanoarchaeia archaeon]
MNRHIFNEGISIFNRSLKVRFKGIKKYNGSPENILKKIIDNCWSGRVFNASAGHFNLFYMRDFGISVQALVNLGYEQRVVKTLKSILEIYSNNDKITTTISKSRAAFDFPCYTPESVAYLLHSIRISGANDLVENHKFFIEKEIRKAFFQSFDSERGIVRKDKFFSSMKDNALRNSSLYNNVMIAMLAEDIDYFKLHNPFKSYNFKKIIKDKFWNGSYFLDDLSGENYIAGDANVFPYWTGLFDSKKMIKLSLDAVYNEGLDRPFPLKYTKEKPGDYLLFANALAPNYEGNTIWTNIGQCFIDVVNKVDKEKAKEYVNQYLKNLKKYKNYIEVFNPDGTPYKTFFYYADTGMLWSSMLLDSMKH